MRAGKALTFSMALEAYKQTNSLENALNLVRIYSRDQDVMAELSEPDAGLVREAISMADNWKRLLQQREERRR